jgi:hypothetical protein
LSSGAGIFITPGAGRSKAPAALVLGLLAFVCALLVTAPGAMADCATSCTWTGETVGESGSAVNWSTATNWVGDEAPVGGPNGTLSFPALPSCPSGEACYHAANDLTGLSANGIAIDGSSPYQLSGNAITLGSGGITTTALGTATSSPFLSMPITLSAKPDLDDRRWDRKLLRPPRARKPGHRRREHARHRPHPSTILNLSGDNEVGTVTVTGDYPGFADPS